MENIFRFVWRYKFLIIAIFFISTTVCQTERLERLKLEYQKDLLTLEKGYNGELKKQTDRLISQYTEVQESLRKNQEKYLEANRKINSVAGDLDNTVGRLQQSLRETTTNATKGVDTESASRIRVLSGLSESCFGSFAEMATNASREQLAKKTLQEDWKEVQRVYNED